MFEFKIKSAYKKARTGFLTTPHGRIKTPNLAIVATHGKIKLLNKTEHLRANPDLIIANTFHLFVNNKVKEIKKAGGLHEWSEFKKPIITDSGGFQVFSLGWGKVHGIGKIGFSDRDSVRKTNFIMNKVKITRDRAIFNFNEKKYELTPEKSIKIQKDLGADIIFTFDECTSPLNNHAYTKKAMERTHRWAIRSLKTKNLKPKTQQALFGIVQGGIYEDLRRESSKFIGALPFEGFGVGGSFGEKQMKKVLGWAISDLPKEKPRHLLGIGKIKDIFIAVKQGIDLFDCVVPTREARHGVLYTKSDKLNIEKEIFSQDKKLIERNCGCWVCRQRISRQELRHYFKTDRNLGQRLATIHNIYFFKNLFEEIRQAISDNQLDKLEQEYYNHL